MARVTLTELVSILRRMAGVVVIEIRREPEPVDNIRAGKGYTLGITKDGCVQVAID